jgi:uncharacterized membrane protein YcaP (DUF421 family)
MLRRNMRHELVTADELMSQLREHGLDDVQKVKEAYIESNGQFSVVKYQQRSQHKPASRKK